MFDFGDVMPTARASSAIIIRPADPRVFVGRRSMSRCTLPGLWETIGGGIEPGESAAACLIREIAEELKVGVLRHTFFRDYTCHDRVIRVFLVELAGEPAPNPEDFMDWGWFAREEIAVMDFALNCRQRILDYFASLDAAPIVEEYR